jgi:hypothetical protein
MSICRAAAQVSGPLANRPGGSPVEHRALRSGADFKTIRSRDRLDPNRNLALRTYRIKLGHLDAYPLHPETAGSGT